LSKKYQYKNDRGKEVGAGQLFYLFEITMLFRALPHGESGKKGCFF
jgi:hypothetical protein